MSAVFEKTGDIGPVDGEIDGIASVVGQGESRHFLTRLRGPKGSGNRAVQMFKWERLGAGAEARRNSLPCSEIFRQVLQGHGPSKFRPKDWPEADSRTLKICGLLTDSVPRNVPFCAPLSHMPIHFASRGRSGGQGHPFAVLRNLDNRAGQKGQAVLRQCGRGPNGHHVALERLEAPMRGLPFRAVRRRRSNPGRRWSGRECGWCRLCIRRRVA